MDEFNNRIIAQRKILQLVNSGKEGYQELFGLSFKSIERWVLVNNLNLNSTLVRLIYSASEKLFFLANKSQEQISDEYRAIESEIQSIYKAIKVEMS